jgi:mono/diheme cytochrome c family protein
MTYRKKTLFLAVVFSLFIFMQAYQPLSAYSAEQGKAIFASEGCVACHSVVRGKLNKKAPELWYAGSKFKEGFLRGWLVAPTLIRPMAYGSITQESSLAHPTLTDAQAQEVAAYLSTLKSAKVKPLGITPKRTSRGRLIFEKKLGCYGCHEVRKGRRILGGKSGARLENAGARLRADWIYAYLKDTLYFYPATAMPLYHKSMSNNDMRKLSAYVASLRFKGGIEK